MYCKECGFQIPENTKYCPNCGTKVELNGIGNIEGNAVWGSIENEVIEEVTTEQISSTKRNDIAQKDNKVVSYVKSSEERKKIIRKCKTNINGVYHAYWSYEDDKDSKLSPQWYEDYGGRRISSEYDSCPEEFNYGLTFVFRNNERACCKLINGRITELTPFIFGNCMRAQGERYFDENFKWSKYNIKIWSYVLYNDAWHVLDSDMNLYKITKSWWPNVMESIVCAVLITFFVWCGISVFDFELPYWVYIVTFVIVIIWGLHEEGKAESLTKIRQF